MLTEQVIRPFQESLTANPAGDPERAAEVLQTITAWIGDFGEREYGIVAEVPDAQEIGLFRRITVAGD